METYQLDTPIICWLARLPLEVQKQVFEQFDDDNNPQGPQDMDTKIREYVQIILPDVATHEDPDDELALFANDWGLLPTDVAWLAIVPRLVRTQVIKEFVPPETCEDVGASLRKYTKDLQAQLMYVSEGPRPPPKQVGSIPVSQYEFWQQQQEQLVWDGAQLTTASTLPGVRRAVTPPRKGPTSKPAAAKWGGAQLPTKRGAAAVDWDAAAYPPAKVARVAPSTWGAGDDAWGAGWQANALWADDGAF